MLVPSTISSARAQSSVHCFQVILRAMDEIVPPVNLDKPENLRWKNYLQDVTDNVDYDYPQVCEQREN